jgi:phosphoenolpyruvate-protein kinase (PTS system EI component)
LGIGIRKLSIDAHFIPKIQKALAKLDLSEAQATAARLLSLSTVQAVNQQLAAET